MTGRSEKLAQEGLCGDRDRLAVGKRIDCRVRQIAHDLKGVCGSSSLLLIGRYGKNTAAMQYQTDRYVRMAHHFTNTGETAPSFFLREANKGTKEKGNGKSQIRETRRVD